MAQVVTAADLLGRQAGRRAFSNAINRLPSVPFLPRADKVRKGRVADSPAEESEASLGSPVLLDTTSNMFQI